MARALDHLPADLKLSSCIRSDALQKLVRTSAELVPHFQTPMAGALVLCRVDDASGVYEAIETAPYGAPLTLESGTRFLGVLGDRMSCTNVSGYVPKGPLEVGAPLSVLSKSGIVGQLDYVPRYLGTRVPSVRFDGVLCSMTKMPLMCEDFAKIGGTARASANSPGLFHKGLVVCGSSAESGKTTLMVTLIRAARAHGRRVGALKTCGTGRTADVEKYRQAGADFVADFVDAGAVSTYGSNGTCLDALLGQLIDAAEESKADTLIYEIGGDIEEDSARHILYRLAPAANVIFVTTSSLAADAGIRQLTTYGVGNLYIASLFQNVRVLARRLNIDRAYDVAAVEDIDDLWDSVQRSLQRTQYKNAM